MTEAPGTVLPFGQRGGAKRAAVSPPSSEARAVPALTLEQFASFVVEREVYPAKREEVRARYGIASSDAESALEQGFRERFAREPETERVFEDVRERYRAWLTTQG